jgi:hypothetical protein
MMDEYLRTQAEEWLGRREPLGGPNLQVLLRFRRESEARRLREAGAAPVEDFSTLGFQLWEVPLGLLVDRRLEGVTLFGARRPVSLPEPPVAPVEACLDASVPMIKTYRGKTLPGKILGSQVPWNGSGTVVAVLDTGIAKGHPALPNVTRWENASSDSSPYDEHGHGSHCAGIVAGVEAPYQGVAPGARLVSVKVLDRQGRGSLLTVIRGLQMALQLGVDVVSMSLGGSACARGDCPLCQAVDRVSERGILVVVAAGNSGRGGEGTIGCPGQARGAITVGAVDKTRRLADFSSRGPTRDGRPKPDLVAPGVSITSVNYQGGFMACSGTSMATPHVAGAAALLLQAERHRGRAWPEKVGRSLLRAEDLNLPRNQQGHGLLNLVLAAGLEADGRGLLRRLQECHLGQRYRCANHRQQSLWLGAPARLRYCSACGRALCPPCYRRSKLCLACAQGAAGHQEREG